MRYLKHLIICGLLSPLVLLCGCSAAKTSFTKGEKLESEGKFEEAMYSYADAFMKDPSAGPYRVSFFNAREKAANQRFKSGSDLFSKGEYAAALEQFQAGLGLDQSQGRFKQQADMAARLKEAQQAYQDGVEFEKGNKFKDANISYSRALELHPDNKEYKAGFLTRAALARIAALRKSKLDGYELNPRSTKPITLKFKDAKLKDVFNIVTQLSGINFIFDEGVKDTPVSIYLENATFYQTLDLLISMNKLGKKILNETAVIVYPSTTDKKKQYEDMHLRTIHLNYMDAKKAVNMIRTMIQVRKIYVNEDSNSVVVRDTGDIVDVVQKILDANDVPDPEVILEVEVIEISDKNAKNLGLMLDPYYVEMGGYKKTGDTINALASTLSQATTTSSSGTAPSATTTPASVSNLIRAFSSGPYSAFVTVPNATFNFGKIVTNGEVLSNPKLRVKNKEKAKFNVGKKLPIVTTTLNGTLSQANVQYVDVGVKLNAEPNIQLNNDIVIKLGLEVSQQIGGTETVSGASVVTIGTRNLDTVLSLKDGETSIIGGLKEYIKTDSKNKIYLLGDIPLLGHLFTNDDSKKDKTELILAITPRLVRGVTVPQKHLMSFSSGKEDDPSLVRPLASFEQESVFDATMQPKVSEKKPVVSTDTTTPTTTVAPSALIPKVEIPVQSSTAVEIR